MRKERYFHIASAWGLYLSLLVSLSLYILGSFYYAIKGTSIDGVLDFFHLFKLVFIALLGVVLVARAANVFRYRDFYLYYYMVRYLDFIGWIVVVLTAAILLIFSIEFIPFSYVYIGIYKYLPVEKLIVLVSLSDLVLSVFHNKGDKIDVSLLCQNKSKLGKYISERRKLFLISLLTIPFLMDSITYVKDDYVVISGSTGDSQLQFVSEGPLAFKIPYFQRFSYFFTGKSTSKAHIITSDAHIIVEYSFVPDVNISKLCAGYDRYGICNQLILSNRINDLYSPILKRDLSRGDFYTEELIKENFLLFNQFDDVNAMMYAKDDKWYKKLTVEKVEIIKK
ncbi:hypothetical protein SAMN03080615_00789 [Amphritea atlantica]|uniref:Uncharacterized protein n=1 Tax=Amphritea atlantica TaxID=355243 RepID=A0A1H9EBF8_9GAMM|nr:hypothetical protein [Amphritea atlantica]SEQ22603.1 hypothetical protein SAMN03080615_00789 [Amphritea atlantica]